MSYLQLIGAGVAAVSKYAQGQQANQQLGVQAGQVQATAQRDAILADRQAKLLQSRARAVSAASGAGADDPTVTKILADIGTQGRMNALGTLWEGNDAAAGLVAEGRARKREGLAGASSTVLSTVGSMYGKYS